MQAGGEGRELTQPDSAASTMGHAVSVGYLTPSAVLRASSKNWCSCVLQARGKIAAAKVLAPNTVLEVLDTAIQAHGGGGVCDDFPLARLWTGARTLRIADGPDDVHLISIARLELGKRVSKL